MLALSACDDARKHTRLLTLKQAAERVQLSPWTMRRAIDRGELAGFRFGRRIRVSEEALDAWIRDGLIEPSDSSGSRNNDRAGTRNGSKRSKLAPNHFRQLVKEGISS